MANPKGAKPDKLMRDALIVELKREAADADGRMTQRLRLVARKLVDEAIAGNVQAIKEINDRTDGKVPQAVSGLDDDGNEGPLVVKIVRFSDAGTDSSE